MAGKQAVDQSRVLPQTIGKVPLSEPVQSVIERFYPLSDRQAVREALTSVLSESTREEILILAFGNAATLLKLVELDHLDWRNVFLVRQERPGQRAFPDEAAIPPAIDKQEWDRRCQVLGLESHSWSARTAQEERRLQDEVKQFVGKELLFPSDQLQGSTELHRELGLAGAQGRNFLLAFAARFELDARELQPELRFPPTRMERPLAALLPAIVRRPQQPHLSISIDDLVAAVRRERRRKWPST